MSASFFKESLGSKKRGGASRPTAAEVLSQFDQPDTGASEDTETREPRDARQGPGGSVAAMGAQTASVPSDGTRPKSTETVDTLPAECASRTGILVGYDDVTVCRYLGIRRRVLNEARTERTRGTDWVVVGFRAGMTLGWIYRYMEKNGMACGNFAGAPIDEKDGAVSVRLVGTHPNPCVCLVERVADGKRMFARVRNLLAYPIHLNECFDCIQAGDNLEWFERFNTVRY